MGETPGPERRYRGRSYMLIADGQRSPMRIEEVIEGVQQLDGTLAPIRVTRYAPDGTIAGVTAISRDRN